MRWLSRIFRRAPPPREVVDRRDWNEDWRVGDLAVCIVDGGWIPGSQYDPAFNDVLRVSGIVEGSRAYGNQDIWCYGLCFEGKPQNASWECSRFRKVRA